jgi:type II secretory pathway component PulF
MLMNLIVNMSDYWVIMVVMVIVLIGIVFIYVWDRVSKDSEDDIDLAAPAEDDIVDKLDMVKGEDEDIDT